MLGSKTMMTLILKPATKVPPNKAMTPEALRHTKPKPNSTILAKIICSGDQYRNKRGAKGAKTPKHKTGSVIKTPKAADDSPKLARMVSTKGPTAIKAGRKLMATIIMAAINKMVFKRSVFGGVGAEEDDAGVVEIFSDIKRGVGTKQWLQCATVCHRPSKKNNKTPFNKIYSSLAMPPSLKQGLARLFNRLVADGFNFD